MYIKILEDQEKIINSAIKKAGSYRKLAKSLKIPRTSLLRYNQLGVIPELRYKSIINFIGIKEENIKLERLDENWKQIIGGKKCVEIKKKNGTFKKQLKDAQASGAIKIKEWHKKMKKEKPKEYYKIQYEKFKKIYGYKYETKRGEKVRNIFEKQVADKLNELNLNYTYEALVKVGRRWFFPDFLINNKIIIEATAWEGKEKAYQLQNKIKHLEKDYKVFIIIPKHLYTKYRILDDNLILGIDKLDLVAQLAERTAVTS